MADQDFTQQINAVIANLKNKFIPNKQLMKTIAEEMHASVMENFRTQGANVPGGWPPLKPATLKQKRKKGLSESILQATGMLLRSIQSSATDNSAAVHTNLRYAAIHNFSGIIKQGARSEIFQRNRYKRTEKKGSFKKGTTAGQGFTFKERIINIPPRPFMVLTDHYKNNIIDKIRAHVTS